MFDPQSEYEISFRDIPIRDFLDFWDEFVVPAEERMEP